MRALRCVAIVALASFALLAQAANPLPQPSSTASAAPPSSSGSSTLSIPASYPDGGISITQPAQTGDQSYYKIASGNLVTFGWNFTYVLQTPKTLLISAFCSENANTYDLAGPTGIPGSATEFVWDIWDYYTNAPKRQLPPLVQASYRLTIRDPEVTGSGPGLMGENSKLEFALYNPQAYTPLPGAYWLFLPAWRDREILSLTCHRIAELTTNLFLSPNFNRMVLCRMQ